MRACVLQPLSPSLRCTKAAAATCAAAALGASLVIAAAQESGADALLASLLPPALGVGEALAAAGGEAGGVGAGAESAARAAARVSDYAQVVLVVVGLGFQLLHARLPFLVRLLLWPILALEAWLQACSTAALATRTRAPATPTGTVHGTAPRATALPPPATNAASSGGGGRAAASPARARPKAD